MAKNLVLRLLSAFFSVVTIILVVLALLAGVNPDSLNGYEVLLVCYILFPGNNRTSI